MLLEPIFDSEEGTGSAYFREPLDIVLGVLEEGSFLCLYFDSRRFEPYTGD